MKKKKVLVFLPKGVKTMDSSAFIDILGWTGHDYGHNVAVDTCGFADKVLSTFNVTVTPIINELCPEN